MKILVLTINVTNFFDDIIVQVHIGPTFVVRVAWFVVISQNFTRRFAFLRIILCGVHVQRSNIRVYTLIMEFRRKKDEKREMKSKCRSNG